MAAGSRPMIRAACASLSDACSSPSALMILARRSRSASACRAIARFISGGRSTSFTSTAETSTPQSSGPLLDNGLQDVVGLLTVHQQLVQFRLAEHGAQRGLGELARGVEVVLDADHRLDGFLHPHVEDGGHLDRDRKSTRLNSSHSQISYAVFCLKKKKREE